MKLRKPLIHPLIVPALSCLAMLALSGCGDGGSADDTLVPDNGVDVFEDIGATDTAMPDEGHQVDLAIPDQGEDMAQPDATQEIVGTDEGVDTAGGCVDEDGDGYGPGCEAGSDCAPADSTRFTMTDVHVDTDMDGFGVDATVSMCIGDTCPIGYATAGGDCDDANPAIFPGAPEIPDDGLANACSGEDMKAATADGVFVISGNPDDNTGARDNPVGTLARAMEIAGTSGVADIFVATAGITESITVNASLRFHGGYDSTTWTRSNQYTVLNGSEGVTVTIPAGVNAVFDRFTIYGCSDDAINNAATDIAGATVTDGQASFFNCVISAAGIELRPDLTERTWEVSGLRIDNSRVYMYECRIGDGGPMISKYGGTGPYEQTGITQGILIESGELRMVGGTLGYGPEFTLDGIAGVATANVTTRGIKVTGGKAFVSGIDFDGSVEVETTNIEEDGATATAHATADGAGIEISGGELWVINSVIGTGQILADSEVYAGGTASVPVTGDAAATVIGASVVASGGRLMLAHCNLHTERFSEATAESSTTFGDDTATQTMNLNLFRITGAPIVKIINSAGYSQVNTNDSALVTLGPQAHLTMLNSVWWDQEYGVCRVHDGETCLIADGGIDTLADLPGCDRAAGNKIEDQLWGWWDEVDPGSPLEDGGIDPASEGMGVFIDMDGNTRPNGDAWDIGAYEFQ